MIDFLRMLGEHLPQSDHNFGGTVEIAHVPAHDGRPNETGENGLALLVTRGRHDQVRHPRTHLKRSTTKNQSKINQTSTGSFIITQSQFQLTIFRP